MPTLASVMSDLKKKGTEQNRKIYARHGMDSNRLYGVSMADLKIIAKTIKGDQALACELFETGTMEAMYLAGMVADGAKLDTSTLKKWARSAGGLQMISEYTVPWLAVDHPSARELALEWMNSNEPNLAASGWCTYSGLISVKPDDQLDLTEIEALMARVLTGIDAAPNRVKMTMNNFVIAVGAYVKPLLRQARSTARQLGQVKVEMGETECKVPLATAYIDKIEKAGKIGKKRKTMRC
jgi:3-methyladenine DNA glycosylase AlkD